MRNVPLLRDRLYMSAFMDKMLFGDAMQGVSFQRYHLIRMCSASADPGWMVLGCSFLLPSVCRLRAKI